MKGILEALSACHQKGWCINDLRLPNVVVLANSSWQIIDAEKARRSGSRFPDINGGPSQAVCGPKTDLFMLSKMLDKLAAGIPYDDMLQKMHASLKQGKLGAAKLLSSEEWLAVHCHGRECVSH